MTAKAGDEGEEDHGGPESESDGESVAEWEGVPLDEDLYGVSIASLLRDLRKLVLGHGNFGLRLSRLTVTVLVQLALVSLQFYLVWMMKLKVTPATVAEMRQLYDEFEVWMYENHTFLSPNGYRRGVAEHFNPERFDSLNAATKESICCIPLSHPVFFSCILLIWTFTVVADLRRLVFLIMLFTFRVRTVWSVHDIFAHTEEEQHARPARTDDGKVTLTGLTVGIKALLMGFVFTPRLLLDVTLLWLGCRWLTSTDNLQDVFLNAVALEFILCLKDLIYLAVVPMRSKMETQELLIPMDLRERANYSSYLGAFAWLMVSLAWVPFYIFCLQGVLPEYQWDIRSVCNNH